jgi:hypothetical protein
MFRRVSPRTRAAFCICLFGFSWVASGQIDNIYDLLNTCPTNDPAIAQILNDFKIRTNGVLIQNFPCHEPVSSIATSNYTDSLIVLQALRVIYYMDRGMSGHLPWTPGTLYNWMKSQIKGIDIRTDTATSLCCESFPEGLYIVVAAKNDANRDFARTWSGISANIDLYSHETRHVAGFAHVSCCGIPNGCDSTFDTNNLSPYGIQWWLNKAWLNGEINVGFACADSATVQNSANWHLCACNSTFRDRFCTNEPALLSLPSAPGGNCPLHASITLSQSNQVRICWRSISNKIYQLQARSDLVTGTWTNLGSTSTGNGTTNCATDITSSPNLKFYRIIALP